jgi:hypothetical protein
VSPHESVELTLDGAASLLQEELDRAKAALADGEIDAALDGYVSALGLALQLGPAATETTLACVLRAAGPLSRQPEGHGLSALGPALVQLVSQVREAGVLPATDVMAAWAVIVSDVGALIGQIGLALAIPPASRATLLAAARARAALLDDATGGLFSLGVWLEDVLGSGQGR